jgi:hypothetical protein
MKGVLFGVLVAVAMFCTRWFRGDGVGEVDEYKVGGTSSED